MLDERPVVVAILIGTNIALLERGIEQANESSLAVDSNIEQAMLDTPLRDGLPAPERLGMMRELLRKSTRPTSPPRQQPNILASSSDTSSDLGEADVVVVTDALHSAAGAPLNLLHCVGYQLGKSVSTTDTIPFVDRDKSSIASGNDCIVERTGIQVVDDRIVVFTERLEPDLEWNLHSGRPDTPCGHAAISCRISRARC
jgi:hypothetical protein